MMSFYEVLKVPDSASSSEIKSSYRRLARENHPDLKEGDCLEMARINEAYENLGDVEKRSIYDSKLQAEREARLRSDQRAHEAKQAEMKQKKKELKAKRGSKSMKRIAKEKVVRGESFLRELLVVFTYGCLPYNSVHTAATMASSKIATMTVRYFHMLISLHHL